jgi:hypothetical protein
MKRKVRMRRMLREEDLEELLKQVKDEPEAEQAAEKPAQRMAEKAGTPADKVLELQKTAGNNAVGAVLERMAGPAAQRSKLATWPESPQMLLDGDDPIPIESVQDANEHNLPGKKDDPEGPGEFVVSLLHGKHTTGLHRAVVEGQHFAKVELVIPGKGGKGMRWILYDVYLSVGSLGRDSQTVSLSYKSRKLVFSPPAAR